jgi:uncharacterized Fe-S cluster-containing radical SAM superfamily protein
MTSPVEFDILTEHLRQKSIISNNQFLITNFTGSHQEKDISEGSNCQGFGRIHHFKFDKGKDWNQDPLPHQIAAWKLGRKFENKGRVQVFQFAACNCRCWYCYVDNNLLNASTAHAAFKTADELLDLYLQEKERPYIIDLSGGQPDIVPEWPICMMKALIKKELQDQCFLWLDDNLTTYNVWKYLKKPDFHLMHEYKNFGRVGCFKGYSPESFHENTNAPLEIFQRQIDIMSKWVNFGLDMYGYITLTTSNLNGVQPAIRKFMDTIQEKIHSNFLLRIVPLRIYPYGPTQDRMDKSRQNAIFNQYEVLKIWNEELANRYSKKERESPIYLIKID